VPERIKFLDLQHSPSTLIRCLGVLIAVVLFLATIPASAVTAGGSMEVVCIPTVGLDIHLAGLPNKGALVLHLWGTPVKTLKTKQDTVCHRELVQRS